jgi:UrcA family protein
MLHAIPVPALALAGLALVPGAAQAQTAATDSDLPHVMVRYDDLNLATGKGRHLLEYRLRHAAAEACGRPDRQAPMPYDFESMHCYDKALASAHTDLAAVISHARMASRQ